MLVGTPDADILREAIEELRQRTTAGAAMYLVKVEAHQGEPANEQANLEAYFYPRRCKSSSVGQGAGLLILRSSVRFRQKLRKSRTQIHMDLSYIDSQASVLNYFFK